MLAWLSVWSEVQTCIWPRSCHCHSLSLASVKNPDWFYLSGTGSPGYSRKKGDETVCVCVCVCVVGYILQDHHHHNNKAVIDCRLCPRCCHMKSYLMHMSFSCRYICRNIMCKHDIINIQHVHCGLVGPGRKK